MSLYPTLVQKSVFNITNQGIFFYPFVVKACIMRLKNMNNSFFFIDNAIYQYLKIIMKDNP